MNAQDLWHATLGELQGQLSKATFDQWVRPTHAVTLDGNVLAVEVQSTFAKEWLEGRLHTSIQRTATGVLGQSVEVKYVVKQKASDLIPVPPDEISEEPPNEVIVDLIDSPLVPFIQVQKYGLWYWQPVLGAVAFATWNMLRTMDKQNDGEGNRHRISVEIIADTLAVNRQSITGRPRGSSWSKGAFNILNDEGLAKIEAVLQKKDNLRSAIWYARVLNSVPYLTPAQVNKLPILLRERHDVFLKDYRVNTEKWEQITLDSLVPGHKPIEVE